MAAFYRIFSDWTVQYRGGYAVIPLIQEQVVASHAWVSQQTFADIITISQMTPGPLAVNTSTFIGLQVAGIPGAMLATLGCVISGVVISSALYGFLKKHQKSVYVLEIFKGLKAASSGLIASAAVTILMVAFTGDAQWMNGSSVDWMAVAVFLASLFLSEKMETESDQSDRGDRHPRRDHRVRI